MTTKEHLQHFHQTSAAHHVRMAKAHKAVAKSEGMADAADAHNEMADAHTTMAQFHLDCHKTLMGKAMGMGGGDEDDRLVPIPGVSAVYKMDPPRGVARFGAPELADVSAIDPGLRKFVEIEDNID